MSISKPETFSGKKNLPQRAPSTQSRRRAPGTVPIGRCGDQISGGGALGVELHYLLDYFLYVGDAAEGDLNRGYQIVVGAGDGVGDDEDVAGAVGALAVLDGDD